MSLIVAGAAFSNTRIKAFRGSDAAGILRGKLLFCFTSVASNVHVSDATSNSRL